MTTDWLTHPVALGFYAGLVPAAIFRVQLYLSRRDLQKSKDSQFAQLKTLTDAFQKLQEDLKAASAEKENLRIKIQSLLQSPDKQRLKLLEVMNRAEQRLTLSAPGFAPAWQNAKNEALVEIEQEERGKSAPKQVLHQLMHTGSAFLDRLRSGNAMSNTTSAQPQAPAQTGPEGGPLP